YLLQQAYRQFESRLAQLVAEKLVVVDARSPEARLRSILPVYFADPRHLEALGDYDVTAKLQSIAVPVFVYFSEVPFGELSGRSPSSALAPERTTVVTYADCGHLPFLECPDRLLPALR